MSNEGNEEDQFFTTLLTHDRLKMGLCPSNHLHHWKKSLCAARVQRQTKFTVLHCCHLSQFFCNPALHHQAQKMCSKWQISIPGIALISGKLEALIDIMPWHSYFRKQWAQNPIAWKMIAAIQTAVYILILLGFENTEKYTKFRVVKIREVVIWPCTEFGLAKKFFSGFWPYIDLASAMIIF